MVCVYIVLNVYQQILGLAVPVDGDMLTLAGLG